METAGRERAWRRGGAVGATLVELMVAFTIVAVALMVMFGQISLGFHETSVNEDRAFAYQKAMAIMAELQNGVERGDIADAETLDTLADIGGLNPRLSTLADEDGVPLPPDHPMSGNVRQQGEWLWARSVQVDRVELQEDLRYVRVEVYRRRESGEWHLLATVGGLLTLPARAYQSTKHYDVYVLAVAEAPSLWLPLPAARALLENARMELQTIENGLHMRLHWITELGYGRDPIYTPFVNVEQPATATSPAVYWYPGALDEDGLFAADYFGGRIRTEAGVRNDYDADDNRYPYAVADQWNHCLREPRARALFEQRVAAGLADRDAPPLQILLDDLWQDPDRFRNAIFVNLHGPALPLPPLRNVSDAAKDPERRPGVRVVTHPERLWTRRDPTDPYASDAPAFRVYAYKTDPDQGEPVLTDPITVQVFGVDLTAGVNGPAQSTLQVERLVGGVDVDTGRMGGSGCAYRPFEPAPRRAASTRPFEMAWDVGYQSGPKPYTWIKLYNTPLVAPEVNDRGLPPAQRLYGMEYVPSPVTPDPDRFTVDLSTAGAGPKNTARWRLVLPQRLLDGSYGNGFGSNGDRVVTVTTRIGDDMDTGRAWPVPYAPHDASETYTWWTASREAVPPTERYQILGDPRHYPYLDGVVNGSGFANGYNWHFDDLREPMFDATSQWPCLDAARLQDGFGNGVIADVPRMLQLLRGGLQRADAVFANPCGPLAQVILSGGEIALPGSAPGALPQEVPIHGGAFGFDGPVSVDSVSTLLSEGATLRGKQVVVGAGSTPFWAKEWLGELCPDDAYAEYLATGNLPAGAGAFHREPRSDAALPHLPLGTDFAFAAGATAGPAGGVAALDSGTIGSTFVQYEGGSSATAHVTEQARAIALATGDGIPQTFPFGWPFDLTGAFRGPLPYFDHVADYPKSQLTLLEPHYLLAQDVLGAGAVAVRAGDGSGSAFFALEGSTPGTAEEHQAAAMTTLMTALRTFHRAGEPEVEDRITQIPLLEIIEPAEGARLQNPNTIRLRWKTSFVRFDGQPYTKDYPVGFTEPESDLVYCVLYSRDEGQTWRYADDSEPADPAVRPPAERLIPDGGDGIEWMLIPTPPEEYVGADYVFRVECYHRRRGCHSSEHQVRVSITR